jgi:hypothetical protein
MDKKGGGLRMSRTKYEDTIFFIQCLAMLVVLLSILGVLFFIMSDPIEKTNDYLEQEYCIKNGYDELRNIPQFGRACVKFEPEPIAHLINCERLNANFLFYFGARPEGCVLLKELVAV